MCHATCSQARIHHTSGRPPDIQRDAQPAWLKHHCSCPNAQCTLLAEHYQLPFDGWLWSHAELMLSVHEGLQMPTSTLLPSSVSPRPPGNQHHQTYARHPAPAGQSRTPTHIHVCSIIPPTLYPCPSQPDAACHGCQPWHQEGCTSIWLQTCENMHLNPSLPGRLQQLLLWGHHVPVPPVPLTLRT